MIRTEDYDMDLIKIVDAKTGEPMGTMNWFSVHATSMKSTSGLISGAWWFVWPNSWRDLVAKIQHFWLESGVFFVILSKAGEHHGEAFDRNPKTGDNKGYAQYAFEKAFGTTWAEGKPSSNGEFPKDPGMS